MAGWPPVLPRISAETATLKQNASIQRGGYNITLPVFSWSRLRHLCGLCGEKLVYEKRTRFLEYLVEFFGGHFSN
jgi:hypothetical protein